MEARRQLVCHALMDIRQVLGENVREFRLKAGLSQEELAARMGVEQGYISRLEAGSRNPTVVTIAEAAEALGVRPGALLEPLVAQPKVKRTRR